MIIMIPFKLPREGNLVNKPKNKILLENELLCDHKLYYFICLEAWIFNYYKLSFINAYFFILFSIKLQFLKVKSYILNSDSIFFLGLVRAVKTELHFVTPKSLLISIGLISKAVEKYNKRTVWLFSQDSFSK